MQDRQLAQEKSKLYLVYCGFWVIFAALFVIVSKPVALLVGGCALLTIIGVLATLLASKIRLPLIEFNPIVGLIMRETFKYVIIWKRVYITCFSGILVGQFNGFTEYMFVVECIFFHMSNLNYYAAVLIFGGLYQIR